MPVIQENKDILGDGYEGDVLGESTPDVIVNEFVCFFSSLLFLYIFLLKKIKNLEIVIIRNNHRNPTLSDKSKINLCQNASLEWFLQTR
jgi:hypothetical protein